MESLYEKLRKLRNDSKLPLRKVAAFLDVDQAVLSKIERGIRPTTKDQIIKLSKIYNVDAEDLLIQFYSDKFVTELANEPFAQKALKVAEKKIDYIKKRTNDI